MAAQAKSDPRTKHTEPPVVPSLLTELETAKDPQRLKALLVGLQTILVAHFADEESPDGLFEEISDVSPACVPHLKGLASQHKAIRKRLDALLETLDAGDALPAEFASDLAELVTLVQAHGEEENHLFLDSHLVDYGGGS